MDKKKLSKLSKKEHYELFCKTDNEGFWYYISDYGPDLEAFEKLGIDLKKLEEATKFLQKVENKIHEGEDKWEENYE